MAAAVATPKVDCIFHDATWTCTFVVADEATKKCMIIDSAMDFDPASGRTGNEHNDKVCALVAEKGYDVAYIAETHVHADHLTGANYLKEKFPAAKTIIGSRVVEVQKLFKGVFNIGDEDLKADGSAFDMLLEDEQVLPLGSINVRVMHTPGHTPACVSYVAGDALFCGDTVFLPDFGSARCDFPSGDAKALYTSVTTKLFSLPDETRVFVGHDYAPGGRPIAWESTIGDEKAKNKHLHSGVTEAEFVDMRTTRDGTLAAPKLILPSLQVNLRNGKLPTPESNGVSYLKIPLNKL